MANGFINNPWNPDLVEQLIKLVREGYSGGMIAARLGVSRNSVIGKVTRLGMKLGNSRNSMQRNLAQQLRLKANYRRYKRKAGDRLRPPPPKVKFTVEPLPSQNVDDAARRPFAKRLCDLEAHQCRFAIDDISPFLFCAAERQPGSPYCPGHHARTRQAPAVKPPSNPIPARETAEVTN
jgi:GcrA cell cycle regulator